MNCYLKIGKFVLMGNLEKLRVILREAQRRREIFLLLMGPCCHDAKGPTNRR
jgi:hypothetical protein